MKLRLLAVMLLGLVTLAQAREAWIDRDEADKGLPPWIQCYNKLKGSPKLLHGSRAESLNQGPALRGTWLRMLPSLRPGRRSWPATERVYGREL